MLKFYSLFPRFLSRATLAFFLVVLCGCGSRADQTAARSTPDIAVPSTPAFTTALDTYMARPEAAYKWEKISEKQIGKNLVTTLKVTSQTWQRIEWTHRVEIVRPEKIDFPGWAMLYLSTTNGVLESILTQSLAPKLGAVTIHVMGIPNQPLFGKREDALMAHSFAQFIATGDETWPLLLPMTKGASKVMDAVQEYSAQQPAPLEKFVVMGASKRGWATWLAAATDTKKRVAGIVPLVYDNLNLQKQEAHQLESWGEYASLSADYRSNGLKQSMSTSRGLELAKIIDPYTYRARLTIPKLIVNATNDPLWTLDSLNLYWNDLPEPKNVYYAPNAGHTMDGDLENVFATATAWFRRIAASGKLPKIYLYQEDIIRRDNTRKLKLSPFTMGIQLTKGSSMRLWWAESQSKDFRKSKWQSKDYSKAGIFESFGYPFDFELSPDAKYTAVFGELVIENGDKPSIRISTPVEILKNQLDDFDKEQDRKKMEEIFPMGSMPSPENP